MTTLRERLPADLRATELPDFRRLPFRLLYLVGNECAAEVANQTMHGIVHLGRVPDESGGYRGEMAVYVKPNGLTGNAYMAVINPFRHLFVYPSMLKQLGRGWRDVGAPSASATT